MEVQTSDEEISKFLLKVYFDFSKGYIIGAIKRAYRDFNRTLLALPKDEGERKLWRDSCGRVLEKEVKRVVTIRFSNQYEFDDWHKSTCLAMRAENGILSFGQTQKWINMTLKYLFVMGEANVPGIKGNYTYFHIPLDRIIIKQLRGLGLGDFDGKPWSKIDDYDTYYNYQQAIRNLYKDRIPMDVEFDLFNSSYNL